MKLPRSATLYRATADVPGVVTAGQYVLDAGNGMLCVMQEIAKDDAPSNLWESLRLVKHAAV